MMNTRPQDVVVVLCPSEGEDGRMYLKDMVGTSGFEPLTSTVSKSGQNANHCIYKALVAPESPVNATGRAYCSRIVPRNCPIVPKDEAMSEVTEFEDQRQMRRAVFVCREGEERVPRGVR